MKTCQSFAVDRVFIALALFALTLAFDLVACAEDEALRAFLNPPQTAKPGVYWFFLDANLSKDGMKKDLDAMSRAGIARAIMMEADLGGPKGNVNYLSEEWLEDWEFATSYANSLGVDLSMSVGPGWCGAGGPWIEPEHSMQHLRASETRVQGGKNVKIQLPAPEPRDPYFGRASLGPCEEQWRNFYRDVAVLAYPAPKSDAKIPDWEEKALFIRHPYSSKPNVKPYLPNAIDDPDAVQALQDAIVPFDSILDVSEFMAEDGSFEWTPPQGEWVILRLGRRLTGQTTRPAPAAGLGLECDKFEKSGIEAHFNAFDAKVLERAKFSTLHHDSWEMSAQNWSEHFRELFRERKGYDPIKWAPVLFGVPVQSVEASERFLWDLRNVAQQLVYENNVLRMKELAAERGLSFSEEAYDLNPAGDLYLFRAADMPMCEFWAKGFGFDATFSVVEAVSAAHTSGSQYVGAEAFTTYLDTWRQHPGIMKRQGDWAFCAGVNRFFFHRMCAQPNDDVPGMSLGPHGTHFDRTQTWFPLVDEYCRYIARVQALLQRGVPSVDVLFLDREDAPSVFEAPTLAFQPGEFKDKRGYNFDACCPQTLIEQATIENGKIRFPGGAEYSLLVLPQSKEMSIELAQKILECAEKGVRVLGNPPERTHSLVNYPDDDLKLRELVDKIWNAENAPDAPRFSVPNNGKSLREPIKSAKWIWGDDKWASALVGETRFFEKDFELKDDLSQENLVDPRVIITADNSYRLLLNDLEIGSGDNFRSIDVHSLQDKLRPGVNRLVVEVKNGGTEPNPAGLIAAIVLSPNRVLPSDSSWQCLASMTAVTVFPVPVA